ncbi:hypothetical protein LINPERPRIM_LOCUS11560 [Linum perenne]
MQRRRTKDERSNQRKETATPAADEEDGDATVDEEDGAARLMKKNAMARLVMKTATALLLKKTATATTRLMLTMETARLLKKTATAQTLNLIVEDGRRDWVGKVSGLNRSSARSEAESAGRWAVFGGSSGSRSDRSDPALITLAEIMALIWAVWRERNDRVWRHRSNTAERIVEGAKEALKDWDNAQAQRPRANGAAGREGCQKWHPPDDGTLKMNVDAAVFLPQHRTGISRCLRDHRGEVLGYKMLHHNGTVLVREVEGYGDPGGTSLG